MNQRNRVTILCLCFLAILSAAVSLAGPVSVGPPTDVAPNVEKTYAQKWPRAAWASEANCYLVVWREGGITGENSDIWCARVSADGKALDPAGIPVCRSNNIQTLPVAASSGKDFLVAWMDFRNDKDWDVYAARVSGDGKVADADGILVSGGPHNQCRPDAIFAGESYLVVWQNFVADVLGKGYGSYDLRGSRVNREGKVLDTSGVQLAPHTAVRPSLASDGRGGIGLAFGGVGGRQELHASFSQGAYALPASMKVDVSQGAPVPAAETTYIGSHIKGGDVSKLGLFKLSTWISLAQVKDGSGLLATRGYRGGCTVLRLDKEGRYTGNYSKEMRFHNYQWDERVITPFSLASDGMRVLLTMDWPQPIRRGEPVRMGVYGWLLSTEGPDGKVLEGGENGFPIAAEAGRDQHLATAAGGPAGTFLVVYSEPRGIDDVKVVARIVK